MYRNSGWRTVLCLAAMLSCVSLARADYEAGQVAWQAGRHAEALAQWREAARAGNGEAMLALGRAFAKGHGVPQDYILAHMWLNLAAGRGSTEAARERDALAANMVPQHIAEAQERTRAWLSGRGTDAPKAAAVPSAAPPSTPTGPPPPRAIREAQGLMATLGYDPGPADGRWGPRTGRAYTAFLSDAGLPPAEMLTPDALRAMRVAAKGRNVAAAAESPRRTPATQRKAAPAPADLHRLVAAGDIDGLKAALAKEVDANARDAKGWTALMYAADKGRTLLVPPLLKAGADPDIRASDGATALFIAAVHGHSDIIGFLMKADADITIKGPKGQTPSEVASARYGNVDQARRNREAAAVLALIQGKTLSQLKQEREFLRFEFIDHIKQVSSFGLQCITKDGKRGEFPLKELVAATERGVCIGFVRRKSIYSCDTRSVPCDWPPAPGMFRVIWRASREFGDDYHEKVSALIEAYRTNSAASKEHALKQISEYVATREALLQR